MVLFRRLAPLLLVLLVTTSCFTRHHFPGDKCATAGARIPAVRLENSSHYLGGVYDECIEREILGVDGAPYQERESTLVDTACFQPYTDESYTAYFSRMMGTLQAQEEEADRLMAAIEAKEASVVNLQHQLAELESQHIDLRVALAGAEEEETRRGNHVALFSKYQVQEGDTLQSIAYEKYNTNKGWINIFRFNIHNLPEGPNKIEVGQVLLVPSTIEQMGTVTLKEGSS